MIHNSFFRRIANPGTHILLNLICCLIAVLAGSLYPSSSYALSQGDEVVIKHEKLNVRSDHHIPPPPNSDKNVEDTLIYGTKGMIIDGPVHGSTYTWYEIKWETSVTGWSAEVIDGCKTIITTERARQKDEIVAKLFNFDLSEVDAKTKHDYNDYECNLDWEINGKLVYQGGHGGWDVRTRDKSLNQPFYSLTAGELIRAGGDSNNTIAIYDPIKKRTTLYLHASEVLVSVENNPTIKIDQRLGYQGKTGNVTDVHVHIEIRKLEMGNPSAGAGASQNTPHPTVDPIPYLFQSINTATDPAANSVTSKTTYEGHRGDVNSVAFSPDGRTIASGSDDDDIFLWDTITGQHAQTLKRHTSRVNSVVFSPDGRTIVSASNDDNIFLWNAITGQHKQTLKGHRHDVNCVAFSPDGRTIVSGSDDNDIFLWNAITGQHIQTLEGHTRNVNSIAFSPDGRTIVSGDDGNNIFLWDAITGEHTQTLEGHTDEVTSVAFSPDGRTIVSGSADNNIFLWDAITGKHTQTLEGHTDEVNSIAFSPDGRTIISGSDDDNIFLWNAITGEHTQTLEGHTSRVKSVAFSPDGRTIVSGSDDETVRLWKLTPSLVEIGQVQLDEDVNGDGVVSIQDLVLVALNFGRIGENRTDVNGDGVVSIVDLILVAGAIGDTADAPSASGRDLEIAFTRAEVEVWLHQARQMNLTNPSFQHGIRVLEQLLIALTPKETALLPNYPNPFNPETWIPYQLAEPADVIVSIYATDGKLVRTLTLGHQPVGIYESRSRAAYWDGRNALGEPVASGVYFYTLTAGKFTETRKMLIIK